MKYIFITGGVVSGLGKGICAASLGRLLKQRGLRVRKGKPPAGHAVVEQGADVLREGVSLRLTLLRHDVADIDAQRLGAGDGLHHAGDEQIGDHAACRS